MSNNICQFYVIFGSRNFVAPVNNNVYINASDIHDIKELSGKIIDIYREKAKSGIKVGNEIIFLIPNEKYKSYTEDIIKKLKVNGKIEIMAPKVVPPITSKLPETQVQPETPKLPEKTIVSEEKVEKPKTELKPKEEKNPVYHPKDNIYRGTIDSTTYNNFQKPKKSNKVPIIIFIISLIFFIISLILLLVM